MVKQAAERELAGLEGEGGGGLQGGESRTRYIPNPDRTLPQIPISMPAVAEPAPTAHRPHRTVPRTTAIPFSACLPRCAQRRRLVAVTWRLPIVLPESRVAPSVQSSTVVRARRPSLSPSMTTTAAPRNVCGGRLRISRSRNAYR